MIALRHRRYPGPGGMVACSLLMHAALILLVVTFRLFPESHPLEEATYYVDMVSLPVAAPAQGNPVAGPSSAPAAPHPAPAAPPPAPSPAHAEMHYPAAKAKPTPAKPAPAKPAAAPAQPKVTKSAVDENVPTKDEERAYKERMAKLERQADARRQADAIAQMKKSAGERSGAPNGKGTEAGSDYQAYIISRIRDAFQRTIAYDTKAPRVTIALTIGIDGRISQYRVKSTTGDQLFEDAVERAIHIAEKSFRKPPSRTPFDQEIFFHPQGVQAK